MWKQKTLHGAHAYQLDQEHICKQSSNIWLKQGILYGETTGFTMAIQDRVIATKNYRKHILKEDLLNDKCRKCEKSSETIEHVIGSCTSLANTQYLRRHDNVAKLVYQQIAINKLLITKYTPYYKYDPPEVIENEQYKIYWDREIRTDIKIAANRPDIVLYDKKEKVVELIDISIPLSHNIVSSYGQKVNKYTELAIELKQMWTLKKVNIRPLIISATGIVPHNLKKQLKDLKIEELIPKIQKSVLLDTCHNVRQFLSV